MLRRRQALIARRRALQAANKGVSPSTQSKSAENHVTMPSALALPENVVRN